MLGRQGHATGRTEVYRLAEAVSSIAAPSSAGDGISLEEIACEFPFEDVGWVIITLASGSALSVASARAVGRDSQNEGWGPMGSGNATTRGLLNNGAAIPQVGTYPVLLVEAVSGLRAIERFAVELGAVTGGTVNVDLKLARRRR